MKIGLFDLKIDEKSGSFEIAYKNQQILNKLSPIIFYGDEWLGEENGEIKFSKVSVQQKQNFEGNLEFAEYYDLVKEFQVVKAQFSVTVHAFIIPTKNAIYFMANLNGNQAKSDKVGGLIDLGQLQNISAYRAFHAGERSANWDAKVPQGMSMGTEFFNANQSPWQEPMFGITLPNNSGLPISFMLGKLPTDTVAMMPIHRWGQISTIRCCNFLEFPLAFRFLSANYMDKQLYDNLAGGLMLFGEDPLEVSQEICALNMKIVKRTNALRIAKEYPEIFEYMGFCTWNTFYAAVDAEGVRALAEENFTAKTGSDRFRYLILDDGWQSINSCSSADDSKMPEGTQIPRGLRKFEANMKFPDDLRPIITTLKQNYGIKWFGVWHAVLGYWDGVEPDSQVGKKYSVVTHHKNGFADPINYRGYPMWVDYYRHLRTQGVDMLKIDNQCRLGALENYAPLDEVIENHYNMQHGAAYSQGLTILNCMAMCNYNWTRWTVSNIGRVSDDFGPGNVKGLKHQMKQCAFNPIYFGQFCWPDHDMVQSKPGQNGCPTWPLVLLHAVSGGPAYFADEVGETDGKVVNRLTFPDGKLSRLDTVGMPTIDSLFMNSDVDGPCKMWNYHDLKNWNRIYYCFVANMIENDNIIDTNISLSGFTSHASQHKEMRTKFDSLPIEYVVKDSESSSTHEIQAETGKVDLTLQNKEAKYFTISPILNGIALLGISEIFNGTKAIQSARWINNKTALIDMAYAGTLEIYIKTNVKVVIKTVDGKVISPKIAKENPNLLDVNVKTAIIIEIQ